MWWERGAWASQPIKWQQLCHWLAGVLAFVLGTERHLCARSGQGSASDHQTTICPPVPGSGWEALGCFRLGSPSRASPTFT